MTAAQIMTRLDELENSSCCLHEINSIIKDISNTGIDIGTITINAGDNIYRMRTGKGYRFQRELSYVPPQVSKKIQRASLPGETMFYGIIGELEKETLLATYIGMCECSNFLNNSHLENDSDDITIGRWKVIAPLKLAIMVHQNSFPNTDNLQLNRMQERMRIMPQVINGNGLYGYFCKKYNQLVAPNNSNKYLITALFTKELLSKCSCDGVLYPPVKTEGKAGWNVALSQNVVDSGKITLSGINEAKYYRYKNMCEVRFHKYISYPIWNERVDYINEDEIWKGLMNEQ